MEALTSHTHWVLRAPAAFLHRQLLFESLPHEEVFGPLFNPSFFLLLFPFGFNPSSSFQSVIESMPLRGSLSLTFQSKITHAQKNRSFAIPRQTLSWESKSGEFSTPIPALVFFQVQWEGGKAHSILLLAAYT